MKKKKKGISFSLLNMVRNFFSLMFLEIRFGLRIARHHRGY
jgi:hypothetical protein